MKFALPCFLYVVNDPFFWPSMGITVAIGMFIGVVIYDGVLSDVKKMLLSLAGYAVIIATVNLTRIIPQLPFVTSTKVNQPFASTFTIIIVSLFYGLGTYLGVLLTKRAHKRV